MAVVNNDTQLLESLSAYINDVKPYHSKLIQMTTTLQFTDAFTASCADNLSTNIYLQNIWTRDDTVGGWRMYNFSGGTQNDATYVIPATVYPRFSINDSLNSNQMPLGTDPATVDLTDANNDGIPDSEEPWSGLPGYASHQLGSNTIPVSAPVVSVSRVITGVEQEPGGTGTFFDGGWFLDGSHTFNSTAASNYLDGTWTLDGSKTLNPTIYPCTIQYDLALVVEGVAETFAFGDVVPQITINGSIFTGSIIALSATSFLLKDAHLVAPIAPYTISAADTDVFSNLQAALNSGANVLPMIGSYINYITPAPAVSTVYVQTGRYAVPFHQGSRVRVNGEYMDFGIEYVVDHTRGFIQFMPGRFPAPTDHVDINYFISDKLFFKYTTPFAASTSSSNPRDSFTITLDSTQALGYTVAFNNADGNTGKGVLNDIIIPVAADGTVFTITALTPLYFQVQQTAPVMGPITYATFGVPYSANQMTTGVSNYIDGTWKLNGARSLNAFPSLLAFTIDGSWIDYYLTQDGNNYDSFTLNLPFFTQISAPIDATDYLPDLSIQTERGYITEQYDPAAALHDGMQFSTFGQVLMQETTVPTGQQLEYTFVFNSIPPLNTYIEFRVEQAGQYNQIANASFDERIEFKELIRLYDCMCATSMNVTGEWYTTQINLDNAPWAATNASMYPALPQAVITQPTPPTPQIPRLPGIYKMRLFDPVCFDNSNTGYEAFPYDTDRYETDDCSGVATDQAGNNVFTYISDDFYLTVTEGGANTVIHNVMLHPEANFYEEPEQVNNLYIHYAGQYIIDSVVVLNGDQVITPDTLVVGTHVVQVSFNTARSFSVWIEADTTTLNPPEGDYTEQFYDGSFNYDGTRAFEEYNPAP